MTYSAAAGTPGEVRAAYAVGRKVGGAVRRNLVRRRLRCLLGELAPGLAPGTYLVGAAGGAAEASFAELRSWLARALSSLGALAPVVGGASPVSGSGPSLDGP